jgi:hypothetical protein
MQKRPAETARSGLSIHRPAKLAALDAANGLLLFNASQFTLADKPALAANGAQYTTLHNLFTEALEQLILRFIWTQNYICHSLSPPLFYEIRVFAMFS